MLKQTLADLDKSYGHLPFIAFEDAGEGYPIVSIENDLCSARLALHGAHLMEWTPKGQKPALYLSPDAIYKEGKAIRGGIPICSPWFNAHPTDSSKPSHGVMRNRFWELLDIKKEQNEVIIELALENNEEIQKTWPYAFFAVLKVSLGVSLKVSLEYKNTDTQVCQFGGALHTYFSIADIASTKVKGLDGVVYLDTVGEQNEKTQSGLIEFNEEIDRIYRSSGSVEVQDVANDRTILVSKSGSNSTVVWNPWIDKSKSMGDLPDDAYRQFLCIEAANADQDIVELQPGESHILQTMISVK